jgi:hypothetical protein
MKRFSVFAAAALLLAFAVALPVAPASKGQGQKGGVKRNARAVPGQYIVTLEEWAAQPYGERSFAPNVAADIAAQHRGEVLAVYKHALLGFAARLTPEAAEALTHDPRVASVEEDGVLTATTTQTSPPWGLDRIDQRDLPLNSQYNYTPTGAGVHAYIIDTGIRTTHAQFGGRASAAFDAFGGTGQDCNGHGTHVAGTVGGSTYGVAKGVTLHAVRVLDCTGNGTDSTVIAGIDWVTAHRVLPAVANMSLGGGASAALDTAVQNSINSGVTYAVAAGNDFGADACTGSPSRVAAALTVGSTTSTDAKSDFSNIGTCVDIFAPGSSILSSWYTSDTATNTISGTSMATPHVAGAAALYLQDNPAATPAQVSDAVRTTATTGKVTGAGTGSPNRLLYSLFNAATPTPTPTPAPTPAPASQLLLNPGFESGNVNWVADAGVITNGTGNVPATGFWYAWLNGYGSANTDYVYQTVTIPSNATSATLTFFLKVDTSETTTTTASDTLTLTVRDSNNAVLKTLATYSNLNRTTGYVSKSFDLLAYRGRTIRVYFLGREDSTLQTSFAIDDTALKVTQ